MPVQRGSRRSFLSVRSLGIALVSASLLVFVLLKMYTLMHAHNDNAYGISLSSAAALRSMKRRPRIVAFGDSLTERGTEEPFGWVNRLSAAYARKADVINRGYNGYNTKWAIKYCLDDVISLEPDMVIVFFGANDAVFESVPQFVSINEYKSNLVSIIGAIRSALGTKTYILLISPPQIDIEMLREYNTIKKKALLIDRSNERTSLYARACMDVAAFMQTKDPASGHRVAAADAFASLNDKRFLVDGLHLSEQGHSELYTLLDVVIQQRLPDMSAGQLSIAGTIWSDIVQGAA